MNDDNSVEYTKLYTPKSFIANRIAAINPIKKK